MAVSQNLPALLEQILGYAFPIVSLKSITHGSVVVSEADPASGVDRIGHGNHLQVQHQDTEA